MMIWKRILFVNNDNEPRKRLHRIPISDHNQQSNDNQSKKNNDDNTMEQQEQETTTKTFQVHQSVTKDLIDKYDGFILDQFGVLHNGQDGLEGAPELVKELVDKYNKKCVILSNSSASAESCKAKLPKLGYDTSLFVDAVTSGQEAGNYIRETYSNETTTVKKALWFTWQNNPQGAKNFLELCGNVELTLDPFEADYVILHGVDLLRGSSEENDILLGDFHVSGKLDKNNSGVLTIDSVLKICASRKLPLVCANPDCVMVKPDGTEGHMPGKIANRYIELLGGMGVDDSAISTLVRSFGKPHVEHFEACLKKLGLGKDKVVHVGDSLHHDVKGANDTGIDSLFVVGGIHRTELGKELNVLPNQDDLAKLFAKHSQTPTHVVPMFRL